MTISVLPLSTLLLGFVASKVSKDIRFSSYLPGAQVELTQSFFDDEEVVIIDLTCDEEKFDGSGTIFTDSTTTYKATVPLYKFYPDGRVVDPFKIASFRQQVNQLCGERSVPDDY
ncbi:hypothetical protein FOZ63_023057 [Perkinsus olseni]|uniref:Uncharacterized protein n=1 Tax=Perkinsus olseni TaxID=32597 RepID=A0A7J6UMY9_PEROL|nr:hypothetical protein FOZ63_023057 [Perkinsus olseni]